MVYVVDDSVTVAVNTGGDGGTPPADNTAIFVILLGAGLAAVALFGGKGGKSIFG